MTCEDTAAAFSPSRAQIFSSSSGVRWAKIPTAPENFPDAHVFRRGHEARDVALRFRIPVGELEAEGDGLGVDAVGAADHGSVFELPGAAFEDFGKALEVVRDDLRGLADEQGLRGVDDVVGGQTVVEPAGVRADDFRDRGGEGDYVVPDLGLDFVDAFDAEVGALAMALAASFGTRPASARVSVAATSTASQVRKRFSSLQMRAISGRV